MLNNESANKLLSFEHNISEIKLPELFTFPFCYQPHPLAQLAAKQLQEKLTDLDAFTQKQGRMFGVLVVKNSDNQVGFLTAVSGNNNELPMHSAVSSFLVPNIFTGFESGSEYQQQHDIVNNLNQEIAQLQSALSFKVAKITLDAEQAAGKFQLTKLQQLMVVRKQQRKQQRAELAMALQQDSITEQEYKSKSIQLARESVEYKNTLRELKAYWNNRIHRATGRFSTLELKINALKKIRSKISTRLQKLVFKQYQLLNKQLQPLNLLDIFTKFSDNPPPSGSGDCAAPKLLQYAFQHQLEPVCMAEFWWGAQPKSEIRKHGNFYPSCQGKCQPILSYMLEGITLEPNPILENPAKNIELPIVYQDQDILVVNKPAGLLSVPGKNIKDSVHTRLKKLFPLATGPMIVHRLDMATSGLLVLSLNHRAHKGLQKQFINKEINKRYVAVVAGKLSQPSGKIILPLRGDINDRPRQIVCHEQGKYAETHWQVIEEKALSTTLFLYPITGRTHQLRVHCAHPEGLNMPIIGDSLYGDLTNRLHLHAQKLSFKHPITHEKITFEVNTNFD